MIKKTFSIIFFCISCTSDDIIRSEKAAFYNIYKNIIVRDSKPRIEEMKVKETYDRKWLTIQSTNNLIIIYRWEENSDTCCARKLQK